jgi:hypothetical protein
MPLASDNLARQSSTQAQPNHHPDCRWHPTLIVALHPGCPRGNGRPANAFAKLKAILRKAAARTIPSLWNAIRDALPQFTPEECANFFTAAGYEPE